jgi:hypothetical protein
MSTDLQKAFDLILKIAVENAVPADDMPKYLLIISDMEFNSAGRGITNHDMLKRKYDSAGYVAPKVVYWNVNSRTKNVPVSVDENGTALISGFSPSIMKTVLAADNFDPLSIMHGAIMSDRYSVPGWTV